MSGPAYLSRTGARPGLPAFARPASPPKFTPPRPAAQASEAVQPSDPGTRAADAAPVTIPEADLLTRMNLNADQWLDLSPTDRHVYASGLKLGAVAAANLTAWCLKHTGRTGPELATPVTASAVTPLDGSTAAPASAVAPGQSCAINPAAYPTNSVLAHADLATVPLAPAGQAAASGVGLGADGISVSVTLPWWLIILGGVGGYVWYQRAYGGRRRDRE